MKHSDLKVGMKVKRVSNFNTDFYTSTKDNVSTVFNIYDHLFNTEEDGILVWEAEFFEPVEESSFVEGGYTKDFGNTKIAAHVISNKEEIEEEVTMQESFDSNEQNNKITMHKKYRTRCGYPVRVLCVDIKGQYPVVFAVEYPNGDEYVNTASSEGKVWFVAEDDCDLIEVSPWEDFKKDDKVMVRNGDCEGWTHRHFSHTDEYGKPHTFINGRTSFSNKGNPTVEWKFCRKPTKEELGE